ncbi:hypothetical protein FCM35_KLT14928 [Carex littledalei]|uniref:Uncharacterized protein n=1 Tax=Carex littledalei TaxID=544730 RepID=A0A833QKX8_9POAL|nr:hypothetical protein FCM35_KLT14928 [Carex littledalei]
MRQKVHGFGLLKGLSFRAQYSNCVVSYDAFLHYSLWRIAWQNGLLHALFLLSAISSAHPPPINPINPFLQLSHLFSFLHCIPTIPNPSTPSLLSPSNTATLSTLSSSILHSITFVNPDV